MKRQDDIYKLPDNLPIPKNDGACDHLQNLMMPAIQLPSTRDELVDLLYLPERTVIYCYPRTGHPSKAPLDDWDLIPGARGCTPQSCHFRDYFSELQKLKITVYGLSTQPTHEQQEAVVRLKLPFDLLSDAKLKFVTAIHLPIFQVDNMILIKRLTLIIIASRIEKVFYPVFPPQDNVLDVVDWFRAH